MLNGATQLVHDEGRRLDAFDEVQVCTHYEVGRRDFRAPAVPVGGGLVKPCSSPAQVGRVPVNLVRDRVAQSSCAYVKEIEGLTRTPIRIVSMGPDRAQTHEFQSESV